jgi:hypothetical protein
MPFDTASKPSSAGINSPAAKCWIWSRPPDIFLTMSQKSVGLPGPTT